MAAQTIKPNKVFVHHCNKCGWNWPQRKVKYPRRCPKCGSTCWDEGEKK